MRRALYGEDFPEADKIFVSRKISDEMVERILGMIKSRQKDIGKEVT
jgi:hypothetical protein